MIGLGTDLVSIELIRQQLADKASQFAEKSFTVGELRYANNNPSRKPEHHLAARYAAKEALIKAWSSLRFGRPPIITNSNLLEIEVINDHYGRPQIRLHGTFQQHLQDHHTQISLSHDGDYATAVVLLFPRGTHD